MGTSYSGRYTNPLGAGPRAFGGAGWNLGVEALAGQTEISTVFDDFNRTMTADAAGTAMELNGWEVFESAGAANNTIGMNDPVNHVEHFSGILIDAGDNADDGYSVQLADSTAGAQVHEWIWVPTNGNAAALDGSILTFACRIGVTCDVAGGWSGKVFIGWATLGETAVLTLADGTIGVGAAADLVHGFHIPEDGSIDGISQGRDGTTAYVEGTNFTELFAAGAADSGVAGNAGFIWYDLALRMAITDMSDDDANGSTTFYSRLLSDSTPPPGSMGGNMPGEGPAWKQHPTVLMNQTPNPGDALVPTIEVINGPTSHIDLKLDWWAMGFSRFSRI